jgi:competence protein ComEC
MQRFFGPLVALFTLLVACSAHTDVESGPDQDVTSRPPSPAGNVTVTRVATASAIPSGPPASGSYRIHLIDVGTGLAVLVQGHDFNVLFDGGSNDDRGTIDRSGNKNRLLAYLYGAVGPSGPAECTPDGDTWPAHDPNKRLVLDHVFLSHPHNDHVSMLNDVVRCYDVKTFWDSGDPYASSVYLDLIERLGQTPGLVYRTAAPVSSPLEINGSSVTQVPTAWTQFGDGDVVKLGAGASFELLHADGASYPTDANKNSIVLRLQLGATSALLVGDAESGARDDPSTPPGDVEAALLANHKSQLKVDILQVGHHGSKTSSRSQFLDAVLPSYALIGVGPTAYSGVVLPDPEVIEALSTLASHPTVLRTDVHDAAGCDAADRVGVDDTAPGGCDNYVLTVK